MAELKSLLKARQLEDDFIKKSLAIIKGLQLGANVEFSVNKDIVEDSLVRLNEINSKIVSLQKDDASVDKEIAEQHNAILGYKTALAIDAKRFYVASSGTQSSDNNNASKIRVPELKITPFSSNSLDKFAFKNFMNEFYQVMNTLEPISNSGKFTYLRNYLKGEARNCINNLSISDENFEAAIKILKARYLDVPLLINETIRKICVTRPAEPMIYNDLLSHFDNIQALLQEMQSFGVDLIDPEPSQNVVISFIVVNNLPDEFIDHLITKSEHEYPTVKDVLDFYPEILKKMFRTSCRLFNDNRENPKIKTKPRNNTNSVSRNIAETSVNKTEDKAADDLKPSNKKVNKFCKFCRSTEHSSGPCRKFSSHSARVQRAQTLKLCILCLSNKHSADDCKGRNN